MDFVEKREDYPTSTVISVLRQVAAVLEDNYE